MNAACNKKQKGFTLIELVMVIVLIALLSLSGASLFSGPSAYSGFVAKDIFISQALLAQQVALGASNVANPVSLMVAVDSNSDWVFTLQKSGFAASESIVVESSGNRMQVDGVTFSNGDSQTFTWSNAARLNPESNHNVRFIGQNDYRVCLSSQGYAYQSGVACP